MATLKERIDAARARQEALSNPDALDTIVEAVGKALEYRNEAGEGASNAQAYAALSLEAADNAADALTLTVAAEAAVQGFAEQARDAKTDAIAAKDLTLEAADAAADAYKGAASAAASAEGFAEQARDAKDLTLEAADAAADAADAAADAYKGAASAAASAEGWATETKDATLFPDGATFLQNVIANKTITTEGSKVDISWQSNGNLKIGNSSVSGAIDVWSSINTHGRNVSHGSGAAIFIQNLDGHEIHSEMSARGFWVEDKGVRVVDLDSYPDGRAYLKLNGAEVIYQEEAAITLVDGVAPATTLKHYGVYNITVPAAATAFDLRSLSVVEPSATGETIVHLWISLEDGEEAFTGQDWPAMVWVNEVNTDEPPTLERGKEYLVAILRRGNYIAANIALTK